MSTTSSEYDITGGDAILSVRQLLKRYCTAFTLSMTQMVIVPIADGRVVAELFVLPTILPPPGFVASAGAGLNVPYGLTTYTVNYTMMTFRSYLSMAFALARGAERWKCTVVCRNKLNAAVPCNAATLTRLHSPVTTGVTELGFPTRRYEVPVVSAAVVTTTASMTQPLYRQPGIDISEGGQVSLVEAAPGTLDVEFPFVSQYRAYNPRLPINNVSDGRNRMNAMLSAELDVVPATASGAANIYQNWVSARIMSSVGEDFNLFHFLHAPAILSHIPISA